MSRSSISQLKPFFSLVLVLFTLFSVVFFKMEVRRVGYVVLKDLRIYRSLQDRHRLQVIEYARKTSPERLRKLVQARLTLEEAGAGQIIHMSGKKIAFKQ